MNRNSPNTPYAINVMTNTLCIVVGFHSEDLVVTMRGQMTFVAIV